MIFPLRVKLALLASLLLVAGIGTVSLLVLERSSEALEAEARKRGRFLAWSLAQNASAPVLEQDDLVLAGLLETVADESEVLVARVLDKNGEVIVSSREGESRRQLRLTDGPLPDSPTAVNREFVDHLGVHQLSSVGASLAVIL